MHRPGDYCPCCGRPLRARHRLRLTINLCENVVSNGRVAKAVPPRLAELLTILRDEHRHDRPVRMEQIIRQLYGASPPAWARVHVRNYLQEARRVVAPFGFEIRTSRNGYAGTWYRLTRKGNGQ